MNATFFLRFFFAYKQGNTNLDQIDVEIVPKIQFF